MSRCWWKVLSLHAHKTWASSNCHRSLSAAHQSPRPSGISAAGKIPLDLYFFHKICLITMHKWIMDTKFIWCRHITSFTCHARCDPVPRHKEERKRQQIFKLQQFYSKKFSHHILTRAKSTVESILNQSGVFLWKDTVIENGCEKTNAKVELRFANRNDMALHVSLENLTSFESNWVKLKNKRMRLRSHLYRFFAKKT